MTEPRPQQRRVSRRRLGYYGLGLAAAAVGGGAGAYGAREQQVDDARAHIGRLENELAALRRQVGELSYNTASGGGVNLKHLPDPDTGEATVPVHEVFSFDRTHAFCRVDTNPEAFAMDTYGMGRAVVEPHAFFMAMEATSIDQFEISEADGKLTVVMRGGLDCATEIGQTALTIGSREVMEHATYRIEAVDGGVGGGDAGDSFAFTAFFDPEEAPVNHDVFGPEATFTGELISGEVNVLEPHR
jgi:hypothetical protein